MKKSKRLLAALLALAIFLGCLPTSISAANGTIYYDSSNIRYGTTFSFTNPYGDGFPDGKHNWDSSTTISYIHVNDGIGYCIQPGIRIGDGPGDKVQYIGGSETDYYKKMSKNLKRAIELAKLYGYPNKIGNKNGYYATQVLIWGLIIGQVDPDDFMGTNKFYTCLNSDSKDTIKSYYDQIVNDLKNHTTIPSFSSAFISQAKTITLKWNSSNKRYETTVTDDNGILSKFDFSASGVKFSKNGNDLTISSTSSITQAKQASSEKDMPEVTVGSPNVWYSNASEWEQEVITGAAQPDPVKAYIKVQTEQPGAIALKKTSEDGVIAGVKFKISGNGVERTVVTGSDGSVKVSDLPPGTYTVSEVEIPGYYETPESQTVKLTAGETASVSFSNTLKKGDLVVTKTAEDGLKQGFTFKLTGTSDSGEKINLTAVTGTDGKATFQNVPIGSGYVLSEVNTPDYYIVPANQTAAIEWNKVTNKSFYNELKKGRITITKTAEDGFKEGFTFKLAGRADNGKWVKFIASTDENGKVTFEDIPIGSNYQVYEIHTPGYYVVPDTQDVVIEWNKVVNCSFTNDLKKGSLTVTKTAEDGLKEGFTFRLTGTADNGPSVNLSPGRAWVYDDITKLAKRPPKRPQKGPHGF